MWLCLTNYRTPFGLRSGTPRGWRISAKAIALLLLCSMCPAQSPTASEYSVKGAYLYNFAKSVEWPENNLPNGAPLVIGVVGGDEEFVDTLIKTVAGRSAGTHPVVAKRADSVEDLGLCRLVFFRASSGHKRIQAVISALRPANILLIGEDSEFLREGGMINLVLKDGKVRFEVDRAALDHANIRLSPEILALAANAETGSSGESRRLRSSTPPEYPEIAQKMNIRGTVQVEAFVRRNGTVREVKILGGHPLLADALAKAVMGWQYEPSSKESQEMVKFVFGQ